MPDTTAAVDRVAGHDDHRLIVTLFDGVRRTWGRRHATTWGRLRAALAAHEATETKDGRGFAQGLLTAATFNPRVPRRACHDAYRNGENAVANFVFALDVDDGTPLAALAARLAPYEWLAYSTWSSTPAHPRYRVVLPLARWVWAADWEGFWGGATLLLTGRDAGDLEEHVAADPKVRDVSRFFWLPAHPPGRGADAWAVHHQGALLDPATVEPVVLARLPAARGADGRLDARVDDGAPIYEDTRNDTLFALACRWRREGAEADEIRERVHATDAARCVPPIGATEEGRRELDRVAANAARYRPTDVATLPPPPVDLEGSERELAAEEKRTAGSRCKPVYGAQRAAPGAGGEGGALVPGAEGGSGEVTGEVAGDVTGEDERPTDEDAGLGPSAAPWTDLGTAERLAARHAGALAHATEFGWLAYAGGRWERGDEKVAARRLCETLRAAQTDWAAQTEEERDKDKFLKFLRASEGAGKVAGALKLASTLRRLSVDAKDMDRHPSLLNAANGVVDLRTGKLGPHDPALWLTQRTDVRFEEGARADRWEAFLRMVFEGDQDVIDFVQRAVGYSLTGDVREETLFFFSGDGSNGKSTFLETVQHVLGEYACPAPPGLLMASRNEQHPTEVAKLRGRRFVVVSETKEGVRLDEEKVKLLASSDPITARFMRQDFFDFWPSHKLWLTSNYRPIVRGTDTGIWRRLPLIPFRVKFRNPGEALPGEPVKDLGLKDYLRDNEAEGILAWAVRGAVAWHERGLDPPAAVTEASREYREDMDWVGQFLAEYCREDEAAVTPAADLYAAYREWAQRQGEQPRTQTAFGEFLGKRGLRKIRTMKHRAWGGVALRPMAEILGEQSVRL